MIIVTKVVDIKNSKVTFEAEPHQVSLIKFILAKIFRLKLKFHFGNVTKLQIREESNDKTKSM